MQRPVKNNDQRLSTVLFSSTIMVSVLVTSHVAQAASPHGRHHGKAAGSVAVPAPPPRHVAAKRAVFRMPPPQNEDIAVSVRRRAHGTMITLGASAIARAVPGTNPLKVLAQQPGVMFQSDDPQGVDTWSTQIYMHGFLQNQISTTLDDMPLGELSYRNYNGLNPVQAISSENVGRLDVSTGAGAESVASTNNLGGSIAYHSSDPKEKMGGTLAQTFGSNALYHSFIRFDSGKLNHTGTKFYVSYMRNDTDKWKGGGNQFFQQVNAKLVQPVGDDSKISTFFDFSQYEQFNYQDYSLDILKNGGPYIDNYYNGKNSGYLSAIQAAQGHYPASLNGISDKADAAYYDSASAATDFFGGLTGDFRLTDRMRWKTTFYGHGEHQFNHWTNPFYPSPSGAPMYEQVKEPSIQRFGILSSVRYEIAHNHIEGGVWYENNQFVSSMWGYSQPNVVNGVIQGTPLNPIGNPRETPFMQLFGQTTNTNTFTAFVQDTYNPLPNLAVHFGFKSMLNTSRAGDGYLNTSYYGAASSAAGTLTTARAFLPHISGDWHFLKHHELYFDIAENVHAYPQGQYKTVASPFAVTQAAFNYARPTLKPESDWSYAVGYRYSDSLLDATLHAYHTDFSNRLQQITSGNIVNPISTVLNVGNITMNGVDAGLTLHLFHGLSLYNSISWNHSTYDSNVSSQGVTYYTKGSQVVAYPRLMYKSSLSYVYRNFDAHIDASYMSQRNLSYTGDTKVPSYWQADFGMRYKFGNMGKYASALGFVQNLELDFNIYNLTNKFYVTTMGENGFPLSGDYQSFLISPPRQFFGSIRAEF
ncbi:TonB-dependent receptor [Acetobacter farinalis]|uniref:TonB-dependent receptor n=1 Tax=Acetobacter farinalis TaxID=1260984 RepID=A0ABT3QAC6_9PROT|nr:TonB-dependent receptor [Acetobacter farinalis]MCX2562225.1 TonB-dependent receptor [Acetobacter farinalis]